LPLDPVVDGLTELYDCWNLRMADIRDNDLDNHAVTLWDPCCACSYYPVFGTYSQMDPIVSNSFLLGYPGFDMRTETCMDYETLTLRNSLKYLDFAVEDVEYRNAAGIRSLLYKEYMEDIYSPELNNDFWSCSYCCSFFCDCEMDHSEPCLRDIGLLPEVALFHNIYIRDYCWFNNDLGDEACLAAEMLDELGNEGSWTGMIIPAAVTEAMDTDVSKVTPYCRDNRLKVSVMASTWLKEIGVKELAKGMLPAGPMVTAAVSPISQSVIDKVVSGVLLPKWATERDLQIVGVTHDGYSIGQKGTYADMYYAGDEPILEIQPSAADLASGKVIDIVARLTSLGKTSLIPLLTSDEKYAVEGFDGSAAVTVNGVITTDDDNVDMYRVDYQSFAQDDHLLPVPVLNGGYDAFGLESFTVPLAIAESAEMGSVSLDAVALDCQHPGYLGVTGSMKAWYQNPETLVQTVDPVLPTPPETLSTGIVVKLQSDILFLTKNELMSSFVFEKNGVPLAITGVQGYDGANGFDLTEPGRGHWFLFEVSPFNPTASLRSEQGDLNERLAPEGNWIFTVYCYNLYSVYGGYIDKLETMNRYPSIPVNTAPDNGVAGLGANVTMRWTPSVDPDGDSVRYDVYLWPVGELQTIVSSNQTMANKTVYNLLNAVTYRWFVVAKDGKGGTASSEVWEFTVGAGIPPTAPVYVAPVNADPNVPLTQLLEWNASNGTLPITYDVYFHPNQVLVANKDAGALVSDGQSGLTYDPVLVYGQTYYWKVVAKNVWGETEGPVWSFTTEPVPVAPLIFIEKVPPVSGERVVGETFVVKASKTFTVGMAFAFEFNSPDIDLSDATFDPAFSAFSADGIVYPIYFMDNPVFTNLTTGFITITLPIGAVGTITLNPDIGNAGGDPLIVDPTRNTLVFN